MFYFSSCPSVLWEMLAADCMSYEHEMKVRVVVLRFLVTCWKTRWERRYVTGSLRLCHLWWEIHWKKLEEMIVAYISVFEWRGRAYYEVWVTISFYCRRFFAFISPIFSHHFLYFYSRFLCHWFNSYIFLHYNFIVVILDNLSEYFKMLFCFSRLFMLHYSFTFFFFHSFVSLILTAWLTEWLVLLTTDHEALGSITGPSTKEFFLSRLDCERGHPVSWGRLGSYLIKKQRIWIRRSQ